MSVNREILASREAASIVSTWTEYLCLTVGTDGRGTLEVCQYEALAEVQYDEDGEPLALPEKIDGIPVIGVEDGIIVGGKLHACDGEGICTFTCQTIDEALSWLVKKGFAINQSLHETLLSRISAA
jgi:hypothetical protein